VLIDPVAEHGVFEPELTAAMGEAFDAACKELRCPKSDGICMLIAGRIIAAASRGELDPVRLRIAALSGLPSCLLSA
jgi:hypothetical protein